MTTPQDFDWGRLADDLSHQVRQQLIGVGDGLSVQTDQDISDQQPRFGCRAIFFNANQQQPDTLLTSQRLGLGFRQIARIQGASINTVQGRYRYAIEKLRSVLDGELTK